MAWPRNTVCPGCELHVQEPYIKCAVCTSRIIICLNCFARGFETPLHCNDHAYEVVSLDFCITDSCWTASEEMCLLDCLAECGYGNWNDIASRMTTRTAEECQEHYLNHYINHSQQFSENIILDTNERRQDDRYSRVIPYEPGDDPPRPKEACSLAGDLSSYMPCRGDFSEEHDNFAECDIKDIQFDPEDTVVDQDLKVAAVEIYLSRVKERCYRKKIVRDYGLINIKKTELYERGLSKIEKDLRDGIKPFAKLQNPEKHEQFIQSMLLEVYLKQEICDLQYYREAGLTLKDSINLYQISRHERMKHDSHGSMLNDILSLLEDKTACQTWLQRQALSHSSSLISPFPMPSLGRKPASRLDISGTPGIEKLTSEERELCSTLRLLPQAYLSYKEMLIRENEMLGSLRLAHARTLIKIDVNKTRKLYDFCVKQQWIKKYES